MKRLSITLAILFTTGITGITGITGCGAGDKTYTTNSVNVNCNTNIYTELVPQSTLADKMASLDAAGADVLSQTETPSGAIAITYGVEQCNGNGNIDQSQTNSSHDGQTVSGRNNP